MAARPGDAWSDRAGHRRRPSSGRRRRARSTPFTTRCTPSRRASLSAAEQRARRAQGSGSASWRDGRAVSQDRGKL